MSGDLISRSKLLEMLNYNKAIHEDNANGKIIVVPVDEIIKYVEKMPTAYNVDKVVEQLEECRKKYQRLCKEQGENEDEAMNIHFRGAINIVKAGGLE